MEVGTRALRSFQVMFMRRTVTTTALHNVQPDDFPSKRLTLSTVGVRFRIVNSHLHQSNDLAQNGNALVWARHKALVAVMAQVSGNDFFEVEYREFVVLIGGNSS